MITGDLTAYAHENQIQEYRKPLGWASGGTVDPAGFVIMQIQKPLCHAEGLAKDLGDQRW